jgi:hypothetical protein
MTVVMSVSRGRGNRHGSRRALRPVRDEDDSTTTVVGAAPGSFPLLYRIAVPATGATHEWRDGAPVADLPPADPAA